MPESSRMGEQPVVRGLLKEVRRDIQVVFERDPAVKSIWEVIFCYPGVHAVWMHRLAHALYRRGWFFVSRFISHISRFLTGIEIHPGARIGSGLFIDHGMGVVIGETAEVGDNVTLYQGVVLGGTGKEKGKRHPTIGNHVVIGAGAKILGSFRVGDHAYVGAGAVVLKEVPPYTTVVGIPGRVVAERGRRVNLADTLDHTEVPDPTERMFRDLTARIVALEDRLARLEQGSERPMAGAPGE